MKRYYDQWKTPAPVFNPGEKVFLDTSDIQTMCPSQKLSHWQLGPFVVEQQIGPMAYCLKLSHWMKKLYPVFNVVKLTLALDNPITGQKMEGYPTTHSHRRRSRVGSKGDTQQSLALEKIPVPHQVERIWLQTQFLEVSLQSLHSRTNSGVPLQTSWGSKTHLAHRVQQHFSF